MPRNARKRITRWLGGGLLAVWLLVGAWNICKPMPEGVVVNGGWAALHEGDVRRAAYDVLIRKAENSAVRLSGGTELPDQRAYWLGRARSVRPNRTKPAGRADGT